MNIMNRRKVPDVRRRMDQAGQAGEKRVLLTASVASMLDLFNRENLRILLEYGCQVEAAANFSFGNITSPKRVEAFRQELTGMGIAVHDIPIPRHVTDLRNIVRSYWMLKKLCEKNSYRMIHTQSPIGGVVTRLAAKNSRKKGSSVVYTAHGFHFYRGAPFYRWLLFYPIEKRLSTDTDILITMNAEDERRAGAFHAGQVYRIPGIGVDLADFHPDMEKRRKLRQSFGFLEQDFVVMSVGQLSRRKNQEIIIRAVALLKQENIRYVLVGLGEREQKYRKLAARLGLEQKICLTGYRSDVSELLQMADCFAFPSLQEGLPVSLMEAMAAGVPVVCSRIRGNCDLVRDGIEGRVLKADDVQGFADAIRQIMKHPKLADRYRKYARKRVEAYSSEQVNQKMRQIYGRCIGE